MTPRRYFTSPVYRILRAGAWLGLVTLVVGPMLYVVTVRHHERRETQKTCAYAAKVLVQARPVLRHVVEPADPCAYLARLRGEAI